jgi:hypothetical protein
MVRCGVARTEDRRNLKHSKATLAVMLPVGHDSPVRCKPLLLETNSDLLGPQGCYDGEPQLFVYAEPGSKLDFEAEDTSSEDDTSDVNSSPQPGSFRSRHSILSNSRRSRGSYSLLSIVSK